MLILSTCFALLIKISVPAGFYSIGSEFNTRFAIEPCLPGRYCVDGVQIACEPGRYSRKGSPFPLCDGLCSPGFYCPRNSTSPTQIACPPGRFGTAGAVNFHCMGSCLQGYFCPNASTTPFQNECGGEYVYCPHGSGAPLPVSVGYYSTGGNETTRYAQSKCEVAPYMGTPPAGSSRSDVCPSTTVML